MFVVFLLLKLCRARCDGWGGRSLAPPSGSQWSRATPSPSLSSHYDTPGKLLEHTEPLTPEPEYATPFSDQHPDPNLATPQGTLNNNKHVLPMVSTGTRTTITQAQYDCPSHRELPNGYCTTSLHANGSRPASVVYTEPELLLSDSLLQHTYEEPF